jgi:hypothetical protein
MNLWSERHPTWECLSCFVPALLEDEADDLGEFIGFTGLLSTCLVVNQSK